MGIFDFLTPKADGLAYDPMRLPAGADPENDPVVGYDELGQKIRRSRFDGTQYLFEMTPPKTQSVIKGAYREATANPLGFTGDLLSNAVQSAWDAISVPRRAMEGQPLTYGDIAGLTGMMTLGAGAGTAPAGALRMGAAREGRPPVTFADAERAMQEAPGNFQVTRQDASQIFGAGSERVRYTDPQSNGTIEVLVRPDGSASVLELEVPEANRGQGLGQKLQEQVMKDFPVMGGQVSSKAAATTAYRLGRRPVGKPNATLDEVFAEIDDMSSVNMVSPGLENKINPKTPSIRAYQGSPHNFAAERLVRMPDGSTQYIVGKPDVLPDVPTGAEVLQDFPLGRMRMDKLGTGEGAQAYGSGLYAAENEAIARYYRDALSSPDNFSITIASPEAHRGHLGELRRTAEAVGGGVGQTPEEFKSSILNRLRNPSESEGEYAREMLNMIADDLDAGLWDVKPKNLGSMYEVNINADPKAFLDWDKPLGQQPESVRSAFSSLGTPERLAPVMGENAYRALEGQSGSMDWPVGASSDERTAFRKAASEKARQKMLDAGVPGIKYLDEGSRNQALEPYYNIVRESDNVVVQQKMARGGKPEAPEGFKVEGPIDERTRNFVVFDDKLISIVKKYGIAGAAVMLGVSADEISKTLNENMTQAELNNLVSGA